MKFTDYTEIRVKSGDGGPGLVSFRAARNLPKLGADGGDGGHGGHVYLRGHKGLNTLSHLYYRTMYAAKDGEKGGTNGCTGACGQSMVIDVPLGTIAKDLESGEVVVEAMEHEVTYAVCKGGHRGLGNQRYLSSIHQAPEEFTLGTSGESKEIGLELKLIADVGLAGFPNAGKSTLLSVLSAARPKVADYPFTTLVPNLGVVDVSEETDQFGASFVMADIPGLIEGASEGRGLGHDFLKHLERTKIVAYVLDEFSLEQEPLEAFRVLRRELKNYSSELYQRPSLVILTKQDLRVDSEAPEEDLKIQLEAEGASVLRISSVDRSGIADLKRYLFRIVKEDREPEVVEKPLPISDRSPAAEGYRVLVSSSVNAALGLI